MNQIKHRNYAYYKNTLFMQTLINGRVHPHLPKQTFQQYVSLFINQSLINEEYEKTLGYIGTGPSKPQNFDTRSREYPKAPCLQG